MGMLDELFTKKYSVGDVVTDGIKKTKQAIPTQGDKQPAKETSKADPDDPNIGRSDDL